MAFIIPDGRPFDAVRVRADLMNLVLRTQSDFNIHHVAGAESEELHFRLLSRPRRVYYSKGHAFFDLTFTCQPENRPQDGDILVIGSAGENVVMVFDVKPNLVKGDNFYTAKATIDLMDYAVSHSYVAYLSKRAELELKKGENKEAHAAQAKEFVRLEAMLTSIFENAANSADFKPVSEILTLNSTRMAAPDGFVLPDYQFRSAESKTYGAWAIHAAHDRSGDDVLLFQPQLTDPERFAGHFKNAAADERLFSVRGLELPLDEDMLIYERLQLKDWGPFKRLICAERVVKLM